MGFQCLDRVGTAGGGESAGGGATLDRLLIADDQADQERTLRSNCVRSNCSSTRDLEATVGRPPMRNSPGGRSPTDDAACNMARSCRRTRLRTTAGPSARPRANATRGGVVLPGGSRTYVHQRSPARARRPSAVRRAKARRSRMRQIKPTACDGPWRGATSTRRGRRGCSCGRGSRASWRGDGCWVGRCASRSPPRAAPGSLHGRQQCFVRDGGAATCRNDTDRQHQNSRQDYGRATGSGNRRAREATPFGGGVQVC